MSINNKLYVVAIEQMSNGNDFETIIEVFDDKRKAQRFLKNSYNVFTHSKITSDADKLITMDSIMYFGSVLEDSFNGKVYERDIRTDSLA